MKKQVVILDCADAFLQSLDLKTQFRFERMVDILEQDGYLVAPHAEKLEGQQNLFAIRITQGQNVRFFYCYDTGVRVYVLNGYEKKTDKIPLRELHRALEIKRSIGL